MEKHKKTILQKLKERIENDLESARSSYNHSKDHASQEDMKSEGKYDTRSIEAGYLAGAQAKRVDELEKELELINEVSLEHDPTSLSVGSLAEIEHNGQKRLYFISSTSGGTMLEVEGRPVLVISAFSPIADAAIGLEEGESFEVEVGDNIREYTLINIW